MELTQEEKVAKLREWMKKSKMNPEVNEETIGLAASHITPQLLLDTSTKLIRINKGEDEEDNRDNMRFATFLGMEDHLAEHINKDAGKLQAKARNKMQQKKDLSWFHSGFFTPQVRSVVVGNRLAQNLEGVNPLELLDLANKNTKLGEGALSSERVISNEARQVDSSQFGIIDPFHTMEDMSIGATNFFVQGIRKGKDGRLYRILNRDGKPGWVSHQKMLQSTVELPEY